MKRKTVVKSLLALPIIGGIMKLQSLDKMTKNLAETERMPVLFLGHGSPMNAIDDNEFVQSFKNLGKSLTTPKAILCISAHWETKGTFVTAMDQPRTIHDFGGFPQALFDVQYPAKGDPALAKETQKIIKSTNVGLDEKWGLDHGAWSVIKHMYPDANVPVIQMSIDYSKPAQYHYDLAKELSVLRDRGVLIVGSGNMVHNLRKIAWNKMGEDNYAFDWAREASEIMKTFIHIRDHQSLINFEKQGDSFKLAIPTPEHYMPLIYALALQGKREEVSLFNDKAIGGSLTMTSLKIG